MLRTKLLQVWASFRNNEAAWHSYLVFTYWYHDDVDPEDRCDSNPNVPWDLIREHCTKKFTDFAKQKPNVMVICEYQFDNKFKT